MLKLRITFDRNNPDELNEAIEKLKENFDNTCCLYNHCFPNIRDIYR